MEDAGWKAVESVLSTWVHGTDSRKKYIATSSSTIVKSLQQMKVDSQQFWSSSFADSTAPLIAGLAGGSVSTALLHPLDLIKVRLQANEDVPSSTWFGRQTRRRGLMSMLTSIVRHEGPLSLYNGLSPGLVASAVSWGGYFFFYERFKSQLSKRRRQERVGPVQQFFASCAASTVMIAFTNPLWLIKTRMQLQIRLHGDKCPTNQVYYTGIVNAFQTIIKEEGPAALYKGIFPAFLLTSLGGVQIVSYEFLKYHFGAYINAKRESGSDSHTQSTRVRTRTVSERFYDSLAYLTMGALSKIFASTCTYPVQVIKTRLQQRSQALEISQETGKLQVIHREYTGGIADCVRRIWAREGVGGFFKGCIPNAIRVAPNAAITFVTYETVMDTVVGYENRR